MEAIFYIIFILAFAIIAVGLIKNVAQWFKNNNSPRLSVKATVVAKRQSVSHHHHNNHVHYSTIYYATFQVESGDRMEFKLSSHEFSMLAEGDIGVLYFQGTRYLNFEREVNNK